MLKFWSRASAARLQIAFVHTVAFDATRRVCSIGDRSVTCFVAAVRVTVQWFAHAAIFVGAFPILANDRGGGLYVLPHFAVALVAVAVRFSFRATDRFPALFVFARNC